MINIKINSNKPIIIIDGSYYIFNRYYATYKWFQFQDKHLDVDNLLDNEEFIMAFTRHMNNDFLKIQKKLKTTLNNILICMDCPRIDIWRNEIYPDYKATRTNKINFNKNIFNIFYDYIKDNKISILSYDNLEGDDVIYLLQKKIIDINDNVNIIIITNDNDYLQLISKNIKIINMQFKDISLRGTLNPKIDLLFKVIFGDKSDNIPKINTGLTKDKALKLALNDEERDKYILDNNLKNKFDINMTLICLDRIPEKLCKNFYKYLNIHIL